MHLTYTPEQHKLRGELREYFAALMTPQRRASLARHEGDYGDGGAYREIVRQLGADGWLALSWPAAYAEADRAGYLGHEFGDSCLLLPAI